MIREKKSIAVYKEDWLRIKVKATIHCVTIADVIERLLDIAERDNTNTDATPNEK